MSKTTLAKRIEARPEIPGPDEVKIHFPEDAGEIFISSGEFPILFKKDLSVISSHTGITF